MAFSLSPNAAAPTYAPSQPVYVKYNTSAAHLSIIFLPGAYLAFSAVFACMRQAAHKIVAFVAAAFDCFAENIFAISVEAAIFAVISRCQLIR